MCFIFLGLEGLIFGCGFGSAYSHFRFGWCVGLGLGTCFGGWSTLRLKGIIGFWGHIGTTGLYEFALVHFISFGFSFWLHFGGFPSGFFSAIIRTVPGSADWTLDISSLPLSHNIAGGNGRLWLETIPRHWYSVHSFELTIVASI
jgi:hypothetical protein